MAASQKRNNTSTAPMPLSRPQARWTLQAAIVCPRTHTRGGVFVNRAARCRAAQETAFVRDFTSGFFGVYIIWRETESPISRQSYDSNPRSHHGQRLRTVGARGAGLRTPAKVESRSVANSHLSGFRPRVRIGDGTPLQLEMSATSGARRTRLAGSLRSWACASRMFRSSISRKLPQSVRLHR